MIADAQDLHHRFPTLWSCVVAGEVAESADGRIAWSCLEARPGHDRRRLRLEYAA